jgi:hypothetical protein
MPRQKKDGGNGAEKKKSLKIGVHCSLRFFRMMHEKDDKEIL